MSTILKINYLKTNDLPNVGTITKIIVSSDRVIDIKCHDTGGEILNQRYDFSSAVSKPSSCESPNVYSDLIYRYLIEEDDLTIWIACVVPDDTSLPSPDYQEYIIETFPFTIFLAQGISDSPEAITNSPLWVSNLNRLTYTEKQERAVIAIKEWRIQKEEWLAEVQRHIDLNPKLPEHLGYWLRSADRVIQRFFQDSNTDPLIVEQLAKIITAGPPTLGSQVALLRNLQSLITQFPNGPDFAAAWVTTLNLTQPSDVQSKELVQVIATRTNADPDETYDLPTDYDSTQDDWIVENQPGIVTYNIDSFVTGESIQATITDYDGGVSTRRYRWQQQQGDGTWLNMSGNANRQKSWIIGSTGTYRCRVLYNDNYGNGQEAFGESFTVS